MIYIVDGSGYIFRAYYAIAPLSNAHGLATNALLGFTKMMLKLVREKQPEYLLVTFDCKEPTFRHKKYELYKANRADCPPDLQQQMPFFRDIVEALGIAFIEKPGFEADDLIATVGRRSLELGQAVTIISGDKDLTQLVKENCIVWDAMRDIHYDAKGVEGKFGVRPEQMLDYLSLVGDSSDNVPGVKGIGEKTAQRLIQAFGSVEEILSHPEAIATLPDLRGAAGIQAKIESGTDQLRLSRELIALESSVEPYNHLSNLDDFRLRPPRWEKLVPLFEELEFQKLLNGIGPVPADYQAQKEKQNIPKKDFLCVTLETFPSFVENLSRVSEFAFDTETSSLDPLTCELLGISISWEKGRAYYLPLSSNANPEKILDADRVRKHLGPIFANPRISKIGLNLKFDTRVLQAHGYVVEGLVFDSMIAAYVVNPDVRQYGLKTLARIHLNETMVPYEEALQGHATLADVDLDIVTNYAAHDAEASWMLRPKLEQELGDKIKKSAPSRWYVFEHVEMPLIPVLAQLENNGIAVDRAKLEKLGVEFASELEQLRSEIFSLSGEEFNLNSPKQMSVVLFEKLGLPTEGIRKTNAGYSTDASVLESLSKEHGIVAKILEYRELFKLSSTYVDGLQRMVHPKTGRIHSNFNQTIAATGRLSSSDPNLQNIPIRNPRGRELRKAFCSRPGSVLLSADYSQIELRILAHLSGDDHLREAFWRGEDIHLTTAKDIFGIVSDSELKDLRRVAKTINFGVIYGISAFRLAHELGISRSQAQQYIDGYFERYPSVSSYFAKLESLTASQGYVETLFGHRRYLKDIDTSGRDARYATRSLLNAPVQGTAAEVIKLAMIQLYQKLAPFQEAARMVLQVHDELIFEVKTDVLQEVQRIVVEGMEQCIELSVPLKVDARSGATWGDAE